MKKQIRARIEAQQRNGRATASATVITRCAICNLPSKERERIDRELVEGTASFGQIALRIGVNKTSVKRHVDRHLKPAVLAEVRRIETGPAIDRPTVVDVPRRRGEAPDIRKGVRATVERLYERCIEWADRAEDDTASWPMAASFIREARQSAELVARLNGELGHNADAVGTSISIYLEIPRGDEPVERGPIVDVVAEQS